MKKHRHDFVDAYDGLVAFGMDRETDENTIKYYLQKFSDDDLMAALVPRLDDGELTALFDMMSGLMRRHLVEDEYHDLFLKEHG